MDRKSIDLLRAAIQVEPDVERLRELALLAIESWNAAHTTLDGIRNLFDIFAKKEAHATNTR